MKYKLDIPRDDLTDRRFGKLLVIKFDHYQEYGINKKTNVKLRRPIWLCKCDCGNEKLIQAGSLKTGQISCGCELEKYREWAKKNFKPKNTKPKGEAAFNSLFRRYKEHADKIGVEFCLNVDDFRTLTKLNCFYCGTEPSQICGKKSKPRKPTNGEYVYNGIDRVDNNKGYELSNVVSCCGICNKAKRDLKFKDFIKWIRKISSFSVNQKYE